MKTKGRLLVKEQELFKVMVNVWISLLLTFEKKRVFYIVFSVLTLSMLAPLGLSDKQNKQNLVIKIKQ